MKTKKHCLFHWAISTLSLFIGQSSCVCHLPYSNHPRLSQPSILLRLVHVSGSDVDRRMSTLLPLIL